MQSELFMKHWNIYNEACLDPMRKTAAAAKKKLDTGFNLSQVLSAIKDGARGGENKYDAYANKTDFQPIDHTAFFLVNCLASNRNNRNSPFSRLQRVWEDDDLYNGIWQVKNYKTKSTSSSKMERSQLNKSKSPTATTSSSLQSTEQRVEQQEIKDELFEENERRQALGLRDTGTRDNPIDLESDTGGPATRTRRAVKRVIEKGQAEPSMPFKRRSVRRGRSADILHTAAEEDVLEPRNNEADDTKQSHGDLSGGPGLSDPALTSPSDLTTSATSQQSPALPEPQSEPQQLQQATPSYQATEEEVAVDEQLLRGLTSEAHRQDDHQSSVAGAGDANDGSGSEGGDGNMPPDDDDHDDSGEENTAEPLPVPQTAWEEIWHEAGEAGRAAFNPELRYWKLIMAYSVVRRDQLPHYFVEYLDKVRDPQYDSEQALRELNASSETWAREVEAAAKKEVLSASIINDEDLARYEEAERMLNTTPRVDFDIEEVKQRLNMIGGDKPRLPNMPLETVLTDLQITGIDQLDKILSDLNGAILADSMGLGKTLQMIGTVVLDSNRRQQMIAQNTAVPAAQPYLFVVPAHLINQVYDEIKKHTIGFDIMVYYGDQRTTVAGRKAVPGLTAKSPYLYKGHDVFTQGDPSKKILITSHYTFNMRHGPTALARWRIDQKICTKEQAREEPMASTPDPNCPMLLIGLFRGICVDEAHMIKRYEGKLSQAMQMTHPYWLLLCTATPGVNTINDFEGYIPFVQPRNPPAYTDQLGLTDAALAQNRDLSSNMSEVERYGNVYTNTTGRSQPWLKLKPALAKRFIFEEKRPSVASGYLVQIQELCLVRRTFGTLVNGKKVLASLPKMVRRTIDVQYDEHAQAIYNKFADPALAKLIRTLPGTQPPKVIWNAKYARTLILLSMWVGFGALSGEGYAKDIEDLKKNPNWLRIALNKVKNSRDDPASYEVPPPGPGADSLRLTKLVSTESPKIRAAVALVADIVIRNKHKLVLWCYLPYQQILITEAIRSLGVDCQMISSDMSATEREEVIDQFNTKDNKYEVLVLTYAISSTGLNLHYKCSNTAHLDVPLSRAIRDQADGRFRRLGQPQEIVNSWTVSTVGTFNDRQYLNNLAKAMPSVFAELNKQVFQYQFTTDAAGDVSVELPGWVRIHGQSGLHRANSDLVESLTIDDFELVTPEEICEWLCNVEQGKKIVFN